MLTEFQEYLRSIGKSQNTALGYCDKVRLYFKWCLDSFGSEPQQLYRANVLDYISYTRHRDATFGQKLIQCAMPVLR